jgi:hypothetical protein
MLNPVDPQYDLPSKPPEPAEVPRFIRDSMYNDDVEGAHPASYKSDRPPRDIMRIDDIPGTRPVRQIRELSRHFDSMNVRDINTDGIFKTTRTVDPLDPVYQYDGREIRGDGFGTATPPPDPHVGPDRQFDVTDIEGTHPDASTKRFRAFRQPPPPKDEDELTPAAILMVPSMAKQTRELEAQAEARRARGEKLRFYENRNLHPEVGTGDSIQAFLRQQRNSSKKPRHQTFD